MGTPYSAICIGRWTCNLKLTCSIFGRYSVTQWPQTTRSHTFDSVHQAL